SCASAADCAGGFYCASGKCLSCGDYLTSASFFPVFGPSVAIPGASAMGAADAAPLLSSDGLTLWFASARGGAGGLALFSATRAPPGPPAPFGTAATLGAANGPADDTDPFTLDGKGFLFASDRAAKGNFDLFASMVANNVFSTPVPVAGGDMNGPLAT